MKERLYEKLDILEKKMCSAFICAFKEAIKETELSTWTMLMISAFLDKKIYELRNKEPSEDGECHEEDCQLLKALREGKEFGEKLFAIENLEELADKCMEN